MLIPSSFNDFLKEKRAWYKSIKEVFCPILGENIVFNSKGFHHLSFDGTGRKRTIKEQKYKMGLLPLVIPVIKNSNRIFKYEKERYSKSLGKYFEIWVLQEIVGKNNVTVFVVLRRIGTGNITFLSVWKKKDKQKTA
jgi:hypothetical protein